jgi:hypothetical protein
MEATDAEADTAGRARNELEASVFSWRTALHGSFGSDLAPDVRNTRVFPSLLLLRADARRFRSAQ